MNGVIMFMPTEIIVMASMALTLSSSLAFGLWRCRM